MFYLPTRSIFCCPPAVSRHGGGWASGQAAGGQVHPRALRLARGGIRIPIGFVCSTSRAREPEGRVVGPLEGSLRGPAVSDPQPRAVQPSADGGRVGERPGGGQAGVPRGHLGWRGTSIQIPTGFVCSTSRAGEWVGRRGSSSTPAVSGTAHQPQNLGSWCGPPPTPTGRNRWHPALALCHPCAAVLWYTGGALSQTPCASVVQHTGAVLCQTRHSQPRCAPVVLSLGVGAHPPTQGPWGPPPAPCDPGSWDGSGRPHTRVLVWSRQLVNDTLWVAQP